MKDSAVDAIRSALESAGIEFIDDNGLGVGVKLRGAGMNDKERQAAIQLVTDNNPGGEGFWIGKTTTSFLGGELITVCFTDREKKDVINFVLTLNGNNIIFRNENQLLDHVGRISLRKNWLETIFSSNGVAGSIAFVIVGLIGYVVLTSDGGGKIPEILANALTVILGWLMVGFGVMAGS